MEQSELKENVILVDSAYVDHVAADLRRHFGHSEGRDIPAADLADWLVCCALDAGFPLSPDAEVQVVLLYTPGAHVLENLAPCDLKADIDGKAFRDPRLGEFLMSAVPDENVMDENPLISQCAETVLDDKAVKRICVVSDNLPMLMDVLEKTPDGKSSTLLSMNPVQSEHLQHVMLGFSLMHAMGIS